MIPKVIVSALAIFALIQVSSACCSGCSGNCFNGIAAYSYGNTGYGFDGFGSELVNEVTSVSCVPVVETFVETAYGFGGVSDYGYGFTGVGGNYYGCGYIEPVTEVTSVSCVPIVETFIEPSLGNGYAYGFPGYLRDFDGVYGSYGYDNGASCCGYPGYGYGYNNGAFCGGYPGYGYGYNNGAFCSSYPGYGYGYGNDVFYGGYPEYGYGYDCYDSVTSVSCVPVVETFVEPGYGSGYACAGVDGVYGGYGYSNGAYCGGFPRYGYGYDCYDSVSSVCCVPVVETFVEPGYGSGYACAGVDGVYGGYGYSNGAYCGGFPGYGYGYDFYDSVTSVSCVPVVETFVEPGYGSGYAGYGYGGLDGVYGGYGYPNGAYCGGFPGNGYGYDYDSVTSVSCVPVVETFVEPGYGSGYAGYGYGGLDGVYGGYGYSNGAYCGGFPGNGYGYDYDSVTSVSCVPVVETFVEPSYGSGHAGYGYGGLDGVYGGYGYSNGAYCGGFPGYGYGCGFC